VRRHNNHPKKGAPTKAVTTPTGNSTGPDRAAVSAATNRIAPKTAEIGNTHR
jgi:hypothetical protein